MNTDKIRLLRQEKSQLGESMRSMLDAAEIEHRDLNTGENVRWREAEQRAEALTGEIAQLERRDGEEHRRLQSTPPPAGALTPYGSSYIENRGGSDEPSQLGRFIRAAIRGDHRTLEDLGAFDQRAAGEATGSAGGFLVPVDLSTELIDRMRPKMVTAQAGARVVPVTTDVTTVPRLAADPAVQWLAENSQLTDGEPTFEEITLQPKLVASLVRASIQLVEDGLDIENRIVNNLATVMAHELDRVALFGLGASEQPLGLFNQVNLPTVSMGTNGAAPTNYDQFLAARGTVLAANAQPQDPWSWVMSPRTDQELATLKATTIDTPYPRPPQIARDNFLVSSVVPNDQVQGTGTTCSTVLTGDWSQLYVVQRMPVSIKILDQRYSDFLQIGYIAFSRVDIAVAHTGAFCAITGVL